MSEDKSSDVPPRFVASRGTRVTGQHKDKKQRITDALNDLRLVLAGLANGGEGRWKESEIIQATGSLARACSVFLRKVVLGEGRNRGYRLLDDNVLESLEMRLQPLRKIPREGRSTVETGFRTEGIAMEVEKLDEATGEPVKRYMAVGGIHGLSIVVEWPLMGMADWVAPPTETGRWQVSADQLFDTNSERGMRCDNWLGQQVVLFDGRGITLEKLIRTVANFEGAHAVNVGRLSAVEGENLSNAMKETQVHILRNIAFFGIGYAELVVIEAAQYLCRLLIEEPSIDTPSGGFYLVTPAFECPAEEALSKRPPWLQYRGGMMASFSPNPGIVRHAVRAPS